MTRCYYNGTFPVLDDILHAALNELRSLFQIMHNAVDDELEEAFGLYELVAGEKLLG